MRALDAPALRASMEPPPDGGGNQTYGRPRASALKLQWSPHLTAGEMRVRDASS